MPISQSGSATGNSPRRRKAASCSGSRRSSSSALRSRLMPSAVDCARSIDTSLAASCRCSGWTTRCVTRREIGSITTSASSPKGESTHRTGLPSTRRMSLRRSRPCRGWHHASRALTSSASDDPAGRRGHQLGLLGLSRSNCQGACRATLSTRSMDRRRKFVHLPTPAATTSGRQSRSSAARRPSASTRQRACAGLHRTTRATYTHSARIRSANKSRSPDASTAVARRAMSGGSPVRCRTSTLASTNAVSADAPHVRDGTA